MVIRTCGLCHKPGHRRETCPDKAKRGLQPAAAPPRCGYCHRPAPQHSAGCKRKARGTPKRQRPSAPAAGATSPATSGAVLTARGNGLDLDSLRQAHALCEQRAQQYAESAQNLKAILLLETALATATAAPPAADGKAD